LRDLPTHDVKTIKQLGWDSVDDGSLLRLAAAEFDVFLTVDKDLPFQQDIASLNIAVIILRARTTRLNDLHTLLDALLKALDTTRSGEVYVLNWRDHV
jgi:hypothetical protein